MKDRRHGAKGWLKALGRSLMVLLIGAAIIFLLGGVLAALHSRG